MTNKETIYRQDVLDLAKKGVLISNGNYESVCKAINELPSVNPQEPKTDSWSIKDVVDTFKKHGLIREQEPCEDAISREHTLAEFKRLYFDDKTVIRCAELVLKNEPPVNPQPKTGHWIMRHYIDKERHGFNMWICSECRTEYSYDAETGVGITDAKYCPNCGAKIQES